MNDDEGLVSMTGLGSRAGLTALLVTLIVGFLIRITRTLTVFKGPVPYRSGMSAHGFARFNRIHAFHGSCVLPVRFRVSGGGYSIEMGPAGFESFYKFSRYARHFGDSDAPVIVTEEAVSIDHHRAVKETCTYGFNPSSFASGEPTREFRKRLDEVASLAAKPISDPRLASLSQLIERAYGDGTLKVNSLTINGPGFAGREFKDPEKVLRVLSCLRGVAVVRPTASAKPATPVHVVVAYNEKGVAKSLRVTFSTADRFVLPFDEDDSEELSVRKLVQVVDAGRVPDFFTVSVGDP